jgi:peptidoglycan/xylan/chitin deacetylase (PgdA/CDA1 family)
MPILLLFSLLNFSFADIEQLPEERFYVPKVDIGYKNNYQTFSLYGTNKYALTFDDGPHSEYTPIILDILKEFNVKATFFVVTERIDESTKPILKRIINEGHLLASHDHIHHNSNHISEKEFTRTLTTSIKIVNDAYKSAQKKQDFYYYRFPYAAYGENANYHHMNVMQNVSQKLFQENCIHFAFWDHDSGDWIPKMTSEEVYQNLISFHFGGEITTYRVNAKKEILKIKDFVKTPIGGGVILFHDIQKVTQVALKNFLKQKDIFKLSFVPLNEINEFQYTTQVCHLK